MDEQAKIRVLIVGAGKGGVAVLELLHNDPQIEIAGIADINENAPAISLAKSLGIPVAADFSVFLKEKIDAIINVTGKKEVSQVLSKLKLPETEIMGGLSTRLMWKLIVEREKQIDERDAVLQQRTALLEAEISERQLAEDRLHNSLREWHITFDAIANPLCLLDIDGEILKCNKAMADFLGRPFNGIIGKNCFQVICGKDAYIENCPFMRMKQSRRREMMMLQMGERWFEVNIDPILDDEGNISGAVHIIYDITTRKHLEEELRNKVEEAEKQRSAILNMLKDVEAGRKKLARLNQKLKDAQVQLVQSSKMAVIGQLASGVAHEINNPLTGVLNNLQLIKMEVGQRGADFKIDDFQQLLDIIEESALRCKNITQSLLDFSRASKGKFETISLNQLVEKVIGLIGYEIQLEDITIEKELAEDIPMICCDTQMFQQVIFNLVSNAKWAIDQKPEGARNAITIKTQYEGEKKMVCLSISDTGIGISQDSLGKIFEPFFTTKPVGEGTGLGLSMVYAIIKEHKGTIEVESEIGKGTTFKVYLPVVT